MRNLLASMAWEWHFERENRSCREHRRSQKVYLRTERTTRLLVTRVDPGFLSSFSFCRYNRTRRVDTMGPVLSFPEHNMRPQCVATNLPPSALALRWRDYDALTCGARKFGVPCLLRSIKKKKKISAYSIHRASGTNTTDSFFYKVSWRLSRCFKKTHD